MTASIHHNLTLATGKPGNQHHLGTKQRHDRFRGTYLQLLCARIELNFKNRNWVWTRIENLDKDRTLLYGEETPVGRVQAYSFGYERDIFRTPPWANIGLGFQFTTYGLTEEMKTVYGSSPKSFVMFLHLRPVGNMAAHMRAMHGH